jgi:hypothetical protein
LISLKPYRGGDTHSSVDGNFHHRHLEQGGEGHQFYDATYFISKAQVDAVGDRIESVRKRPAKVYKPKAPDAAVDECEESHEAADGRKEKTNTDKFDDTGLMALVCRHDIPLFLANIDTPGEQQKYAVALIEHLYSMLLSCATGVVLYDVACVLDRSLQLVSTVPTHSQEIKSDGSHQYDILPITITERLLLATSAMHAYGHQWACQLVFNPRLRPGLGLTDGEGTERL